MSSITWPPPSTTTILLCPFSTRTSSKGRQTTGPRRRRRGRRRLLATSFHNLIWYSKPCSARLSWLQLVAVYVETDGRRGFPHTFFQTARFIQFLFFSPTLTSYHAIDDIVAARVGVPLTAGMDPLGTSYDGSTPIMSLEEKIRKYISSNVPSLCLLFESTNII